ncbi:VirB3 family type IV secretion system protein [Rhizobium sp. K102]|uniref:type IV secretion system protein VirB3 n=1 Tax=Rhizobium sp. K102 TaxID=2918527 RepID=UPI001EFAA937|nr:VirB3 family type IV secretion system protein [Rhizobium sp. K102]ULR47568.1 VirB3 family type IV secretion system protein [Rhizobium sp. K102]
MATAPSLEEDILFLACTRPAMIAGVTMEAMGVNIMLTTILYITAGSIAYALVGLVFHVVFRALVKHDHNIRGRQVGGRCCRDYSGASKRTRRTRSVLPRIEAQSIDCSDRRILAFV